MALEVGDVAAIPLAQGGYGACQVTAISGGAVTACALAWLSDDRPELRHLIDAKPLMLNHHQHLEVPAEIGINEDEPPPAWTWLGRLPVPAGLPGPGGSSSGWDWLPAQIIAQRRWDQHLPAEAKRAYRAGTTRGIVEVDFGAGPAAIGAATAGLDLTGAGAVRVPSTGPVRWSALDALPCCTSLGWDGPSRGLIAALAHRPIVEHLQWTDASGPVDLLSTGLTSLSIGGRIDTLRLPDGLQRLTLLDNTHVGYVTAAGRGRWLRLAVSSSAADAGVPDGLDGVRDLVRIGNGTVSAAPLRALRDLETLWLAWREGPGALLDAGALAGLPRLAQLTLTDAYDIDADTLPELPAVSALTIHGLRRSAVSGMKARHRRVGVRVTLSGAKNDTWLAANLTNPFRDWADDDVRAGTAACKAYAAAVRAVDALPEEARDRPAVVEPILRAFIAHLNRIDERHDIIDTLRREEAGDAFLKLAARAAVPSELADQWFDAWRDF